MGMGKGYAKVTICESATDSTLKELHITLHASEGCSKKNDTD